MWMCYKNVFGMDFGYRPLDLYLTIPTNRIIIAMTTIEIDTDLNLHLGGPLLFRVVINNAANCWSIIKVKRSPRQRFPDTRKLSNLKCCELT